MVYALTVFNNELIAGGYVDSVAGMPIQKVARWNGAAWSAMGNDCSINTIRCFCVHNGELYAGGQASGALNNRCVEKWNGTNWVPIENSGSGHEVWSMASYNGELYACGNFTALDGVTVNGVARWNGTAWSDVGGSIPGITVTDIVKTLAVFDGKLYAGGHFFAMGTATVNDIASWDGSSWADVGGGVGGSTAGVQSLLPFGGKLFVGGSYWTVNGVDANRAAYWDGSAWTVLGLDLGAGARSMAVYNTDLYSFGEGAFNGQSYAARWTGGAFSGIAETNSPVLVQMAPNPVEQDGTITVDLHLAAASAGSPMLSIIGADGRIVHRERMSEYHGEHMEISLGGIASGPYTIAICDNTGSLIAHGGLIVQ